MVELTVGKHAKVTFKLGDEDDFLIDLHDTEYYPYIHLSKDELMDLHGWIDVQLLDLIVENPKEVISE